MADEGPPVAGSTPPAGYYPTDQGQRWWNGSAWTDQFAPPAPTAQPQSRQQERPRATAPRPWWKKKRFIIPGVLLALVVIASLGGGDDKTTDVSTGDPPAVTEPGGAGSAVSPTTKAAGKLFPGRPDSKKTDIERNVGEAAQLAGYTVTLSSAPFKQQISQFESDGYLVASVTIANRDKKAQPYNPFDWKLVTPGGQIIDPTFTTGEQLASGDLVMGGSITGDITWEVGAQKGVYYVIYDVLGPRPGGLEGDGLRLPRVRAGAGGLNSHRREALSLQYRPYGPLPGRRRAAGLPSIWSRDSTWSMSPCPPANASPARRSEPLFLR